MIRPLRALALASLLLLTAGTSALAQTPSASPSSSSTSATLEGLQEGVTRQYASDPKTVPADNPDEFSIITVHIFRYDTSEHAAAAWQSLRDSVAQQFQPATDSGYDPIDVQEKSLNDLGDQAYVAWLSSSPEEGVTGYYRVLYVQQGDYLYLLTAIGGNEDTTLRSDDLARTLVDRDAGTTSTSFNADGTSSGGIWDIFPAADDDVVKDLTPVQDREVTIPTT